MIHSKYLIIDEQGLELPIVFNPIFQHKDIAAGRKVLGAGFCHANYVIDGKTEWNTWGESVSLKIKSRPDDSYILNNYLSCDC